MILRTWHIRHASDWDAYVREVVALSYGRLDVRIVCTDPGIISLVQK